MKNISFAMYSPLAFIFGYRQYGFSKREIKRRIEFQDSPLMDFCKLRLQGVDRSNITLLGTNLREGINTGRILLIRNEFSKYYEALYGLIEAYGKDIHYYAIRDLSNILLASQMQIPLWLEKNATFWIEDNYKFKMKRKSDLITLPFTSENPKYHLRDALAKLNALFNQKVGLEELVTKLKQDLKKVTKIAFQTKGIALSILEPLPVWEKLALTQRYSISAILTIIDILGIKRINK